MIGIGIDTGGTCTDAVIYDLETREILATGKTLTTKSNLEIGIAKVLESLPEELLRQAKSLSLSTTLATNACVENKGCRAKLLIIGADPEVIARISQTLSDYGLRDISQLVVFDAKAENLFSQPYDPDWEKLREEAPFLFADCDCVGIVQTFPGANGGRFELTALQILKERLTIPLTIAYDICQEKDFLKVCASTLLNARLIPLIADFIKSVHHVMERMQLHMPLMIVRSDGTLMSEEMARTCPVETLLCGPAASVIGGCELSGEPDAFLLDMGGTTTDIAMVRAEEPKRATAGIQIGQYQTSIKGLDAQAISLGGDTAVRFRDQKLYLDTVRMIPISILADQYETVLPAIEKLAQRTTPHTRMIHEFYVLQKDIEGRAGYTEEEQSVCQALKDGPLMTLDLVKKLGADLYHLDTGRLEQEGIIIKSGITPTDMMVLKGDLTIYDRAAAETMLRYISMNLDVGPEQIPEIVYEMVIHRMYQSLGAFILRQQYPKMAASIPADQQKLLLDEFYRDACTKGSKEVQMQLCTNLPLVGIGAPIHVFLPKVATLFGTRAVLSEYSHVANALGAASAHRTTHLETVIHVEYDGFDISGYAVMADCRKQVFKTQEEAVAFASDLAEKAVRKQALFQGISEDPHIELSVEERFFASKLLMEILIHATARP